MVLGYGDSIAYDALVEKVTGHRPDKTHRFTDWSRRPLSKEQIVYAEADVTHLRDVFKALDADLKKRGRSDWVSEEMEVLTSPRTYDNEPSRAWERLKTRVRKPKELAVLMEVAAWREREAQTRDVPRSRVLKDDAIGDIATHAPTSLEKLAHLRSIPKGFERSKWGSDIVAAVERGIARDPHNLPKLDKPRGNAAGSATVELLKVLLRMTAEKNHVAAKVIATIDDLEQIATDDDGRRPCPARLAARAVRRSRAGAQARPTGAGGGKGPRGSGRPRLSAQRRSIADDSPISRVSWRKRLAMRSPASAATRGSNTSVILRPRRLKCVAPSTPGCAAEIRCATRIAVPRICAQPTMPSEISSATRGDSSSCASPRPA